MVEESDPISLADWRRQVTELYVAVRRDLPHDPIAAWMRFRAGRDELFESHPQTPLSNEQAASFDGLKYHAYDEAYRVVGRIRRGGERQAYQLQLAADGLFRYSRFAEVDFVVKEIEASLCLYWVEGYGGGLFLPFRDRTNSAGSFGGGRYLLDAIKGADLGMRGDELILDFNFAYNPSCAYHARWLCPLAPPENRLAFAIEAGEMDFHALRP